MVELFSIDMLLGAVVAGIVSWLTIPPIVRVARTKNLVAITNGRSNHKGSIPALGGVAIFAAMTVAGVLFMPASFPNELRYVGFAVLTMFLIGVKDDLVEIDAFYKLLAQIVAALVIVLMGDIRIHSLFGFFGVYDLPYWISVIISLLLFVVIVNSINLIDGIDGLASGLGIQISILFGIALTYLNQPSYATLAFIFTGALIPFYVFNVFGKNYKLFMGDTGSLILGTVFAILALKIACCPVPNTFFLDEIKLPVFILAILIIPIGDAIKVFLIRVVKRESPFHGDMNHLHHNMLDTGLTHGQASSVIFIMNLFIVAIIFFLRDLNELILLALTIFLGFLAVAIPWILISKKTEPKVNKTLVHEAN